MMKYKKVDDLIQDTVQLADKIRDIVAKNAPEEPQPYSPNALERRLQVRNRF